MIPFNKPYLTGNEIQYLTQAIEEGHLSGDGAFTRQCHSWLISNTGAAKALLTHSCTAALEMAALLIDLCPGDEIIMPAYTFVSTANAFVLRGAIPVFVDICPDTLNIDPDCIEQAITAKTKAIVPVHYAGVACEMDTILDIARRHNLYVIEDAAQGIMSTYKNKPLGTIGDIGAFSFHETKNIISGEGGALLLRDADFAERAEIVREKGTNRSLFFRGQVDKYTWCDIGSSYLPSELIAAVLYAQLEKAEFITSNRLDIWNRYHEALAPLEQAGHISRPVVPSNCRHNAHMYYILAENLEVRTRLIEHLRTCEISAPFHYIPLQTSPMGQKVGRYAEKLNNTDKKSEQILRLPLFAGMTKTEQDTVINAVKIFF